MAKVKTRKDAGSSDLMSATDKLSQNPAFMSRVKKEETRQKYQMTQQLQNDMKRMQNDELFPDMQFVCGSVSFAGHKFILKSRSQNQVTEDWFETSAGAVPTLHLCSKTQEDSKEFINALYTADEIDADFIIAGLKTQNQTNSHKTHTEEQVSQSSAADIIEDSAVLQEKLCFSFDLNVGSESHLDTDKNKHQDLQNADLSKRGNFDETVKNGIIVEISSHKIESGAGESNGVSTDLQTHSADETKHDISYQSEPIDPDLENKEAIPKVSADQEIEVEASAAQATLENGHDEKSQSRSPNGNMNGLLEAASAGRLETGPVDQSETSLAKQELPGMIDPEEVLSRAPAPETAAQQEVAQEVPLSGNQASELADSKDHKVSEYVNKMAKGESKNGSSLTLESASVSGQSENGSDRDAASSDVTYKGCSSLASNLLQSYLNGENTDCCLTAEGQKFFTHRCILAARCQYFEAMFAGTWCESEEMEIELHGVKAQSLKYVLLFLYGAMVKVPIMEITSVIQASDMFGVEGLKEWLGFHMARDFCHFFHKPCQDCTRTVPDILVLASQFNLTDLSDRAQRWIATHFRRIWEMQTFGSLHAALLEECTNAVVDQMSIQNITQVILDAHVLARSLQRNHRSEQVQIAAIKIMDEAIAFCARNFPQLVKSHNFLSWSKSGAWCIDVLEESYIMVVSLLQPEVACEVYSSLRQLLATSEIEDGSFYTSEEVRHLLKKLVERCEWYLHRYIHRVTQCPQWSQLTAELQQELLQKSSFVPVHAATAVGAQSRVAQKSAKALQDNIVHTVSMLCETNPSLFPSLSQTRKILYNNSTKHTSAKPEIKTGLASETRGKSSSKSQAGAQKGKPAAASKRNITQGKNASTPARGKEMPGKGASASASAASSSKPSSERSKEAKSTGSSATSSSEVKDRPSSAKSSSSQNRTNPALSSRTTRPSSGQGPGKTSSTPPRTVADPRSGAVKSGAPSKSSASTSSPAVARPGSARKTESQDRHVAASTTSQRPTRSNLAPSSGAELRPSSSKANTSRVKSSSSRESSPGTSRSTRSAGGAAKATSDTSGTRPTSSQKRVAGASSSSSDASSKGSKRDPAQTKGKTMSQSGSLAMAGSSQTGGAGSSAREKAAVYAKSIAGLKAKSRTADTLTRPSSATPRPQSALSTHKMSSDGLAQPSVSTSSGGTIPKRPLSARPIQGNDRLGTKKSSRPASAGTGTSQPPASKPALGVHGNGVKTSRSATDTGKPASKSDARKSSQITRKAVASDVPNITVSGREASLDPNPSGPVQKSKMKDGKETLVPELPNGGMTSATDMVNQDDVAQETSKKEESSVPPMAVEVQTAGLDSAENAITNDSKVPGDQHSDETLQGEAEKTSEPTAATESETQSSASQKRSFVDDGGKTEFTQSNEVLSAAGQEIPVPAFAVEGGSNTSDSQDSSHDKEQDEHKVGKEISVTGALEAETKTSESHESSLKGDEEEEIIQGKQAEEVVSNKFSVPTITVETESQSSNSHQSTIGEEEEETATHQEQGEETVSEEVEETLIPPSMIEAASAVTSSASQEKPVDPDDRPKFKQGNETMPSEAEETQIPVSVLEDDSASGMSSFQEKTPVTSNNSETMHCGQDNEILLGKTGETETVQESTTEQEVSEKNPVTEENDDHNSQNK